MKNILVLSYMLSPTKGSEFSVAWNYITQMSIDNKLTVLYGISGKHMGNVEEMEMWAKEHPHQHIEFVPVLPNKTANFLNWPNRHDLFVYTFYYAYRVWQKQVYKKAQELIASEHFDLIHYVGMIGYREPGYLWKLGLPYVWGPISGANNPPWQLLKPMTLPGKLKHGFRTIANILQLHTSRRLRKALKATDVLLTATSENQASFQRIHHKDSICIPENVIERKIKLDMNKFMSVKKYHLIIVGTLDARKSVITALKAVSLIKYKERIHLDIVGDGPLINTLKIFAKENRLDELTTWHGKVTREEAISLFDRAHLHLITSVSEGNPTTIWEAMSCGVPTMSLDHCGMHDTLCDGAGILIPIAANYDECVQKVSNKIEYLLENPEEFLRLAKATIDRAQMYTWTQRRIFWNDLYDKLLNRKK